MGASADRKSPRFRVELAGRFRRAGTFQWTDVVVVNLSKTGLCFQTRSELIGEDLIELEIDTRDAADKPHQRRVVGKIQWRRGQRYGVRFI